MSQIYLYGLDDIGRNILNPWEIIFVFKVGSLKGFLGEYSEYFILHFSSEFAMQIRFQQSFKN